LPLPSAAAALAALHAVPLSLPLTRLPLSIGAEAIRNGLRAATLPGRFQQLQWRGIEIILDVAHNPQAANWLALRLRSLQEKAPPRYTRAVLAIMADKDVAGVVAAVQAQIQHWYIGDLTGNTRALKAVALAAAIKAHSAATVVIEADLTQAFLAALQQARAGERIVVFGSFFTVAAALAHLQKLQTSTKDLSTKSE
jgi:dihydrofolate synthase / folylpolyglutamate synthase